MHRQPLNARSPGRFWGSVPTTQGRAWPTWPTSYAPAPPTTYGTHFEAPAVQSTHAQAALPPYTTSPAVAPRGESRWTTAPSTNTGNAPASAYNYEQYSDPVRSASYPRKAPSSVPAQKLNYSGWGQTNSDSWVGSAPQSDMERSRSYSRPQSTRSRSEPPPVPLDWHPLLKPAECVDNDDNILVWDVRYKTPVDIAGKTLAKAVLNTPATYPLKTALTLLCPCLPWKVVVANPKGVTLTDVLSATYQMLSVPLSEGEYWLVAEDQRQRMNAAYKMAVDPRSGVPERNAEDGIKRVDFLGDQVMFGGIRPMTVWDEGFVMKRLARKGEDIWIMEFYEPMD